MFTQQSIKEIAGSNFFSVTFIKKDGTERTYNACRFGVKKYLKGNGNTKSTTEANPDNVCVWVHEDGEAKYRTIRLNTIIRIAMNKQVWVNAA